MIQQAHHLRPGEQPRRQRRAGTRCDRQRLLGDVVHLVVVAILGDVAEIHRRGHRLVGHQRGQPILVGHPGPAAGRGGVIGQAGALLALALGLGVGGLLQGAVDDAQQPLEQHVVAGHLRRVVAPHARPREQLDRRAGGVLHPLLDAEHVVVVDRQHDLEGQPGGVVPRQRHRRADAKRRRRGRPYGVVARQLHRLPGRRGPAILHVIRLRIGARLQQPHQRRVRCQRFAIVLQLQVVDPRAQQADRAHHPRRVDLHPRHVLRHRIRLRQAARPAGRGNRLPSLG